MRAVLLFALLLSAVLRAQVDPSLTFNVRKFDVSDGLANRRVNAVVHDRAGFLWIATASGLQRFDGYTFITFTRSEGLARNDVDQLWLDGNGLLWIFYHKPFDAFLHAIDVMDPRTGDLASFERHFGGQLPLPVQDLVGFVRFTADSTMWIGAKGGMLSYHPRHGFRFVQGDAGTVYEPVGQERDGHLLMKSWTAGGDAGRLIRVGADGSVGDTLLKASWIECVSLSERSMEGHLFQQRAHPAGGGYFVRRVRREVEMEPFWLPDHGQPKFFEVTPTWWKGAVRPRRFGEDLWLVNTSVRRMHAGDDPETAPVVCDLAAQFPELGFRIHDVCADVQGQVWVGAEFGLYALQVSKDRFGRALWSRDISSGFGKRMRGMLILPDPRDPGHDILVANTELEGHWIVDHRGKEADVTFDTPWYHGRLGMAADGSGGLWSTKDDSLIRFGPDGTRRMGHGFSTRLPAWCILRVPGDDLLLGSEHGIDRYVPRSKGYVLSQPVTQDDGKGLSELLHASHVVQLGRDRSGAILACSNNGLFRVDEEGRPLDRWAVDREGAHRLPALDFRCFLETEDSVLWLATGDAGLVRWDRRTGAARAITRNNGMPTNTVHAVLPDELGNLWMSTDDGLVRYDPITDQLAVFTTADGITHNEFNRLAYAKGSDGRLYFGGLNGVTVVDPKAMREERWQVDAPLLVTSVQQYSAVEDRVVDRAFTSGLQELGLVMEPGDRFVNINFALLSFEEREKVLYGWRIDGVDADWNYQREPSVRFNALPYGRHMLRIKAQAGDGVWTRGELMIPIEVVRPYWLRWWFIVVCASVVLAIVYAIFRYRLAQARKVLAMRDRIAADLHDEVGSSLSNIAMFGELMRDQLADQPPKVRRMVERITSNSAKALESMNDIVWNVNTRYEGTEHLVARMRAFAAQAAEARGFALRFEADEALRSVKLDMMHRKHLYLVFKEAVNNAAKYSSCTELKVSLAAQAAGIGLVVADNGRGFAAGDQDARGGGQGLAGMRKRAEEIGAELTVRSVVGEGTIITLTPGSSPGSRTLATQRSAGSGSFAP